MARGSLRNGALLVAVILAPLIGVPCGLAGQTTGPHAVMTAPHPMTMPSSSALESSSAMERQGPVYQSEGTKKMAALLVQIYRATDWRSDPNKPAERAEYYKSLLQRRLTFAQEASVRQELGVEQLRAGDSAAAIETLEALRRWARGQPEYLSAEAEHSLSQWLAISYLRLGEQENCQHQHGQKFCVFPIQKGGVHTVTRGAEGAMREFTALLQKDGQDAESRWLLNVAAMQLGRYPQGVPKQWLIPSGLFASEHAMADFPDVAAQLGLDITGHAGGLVMEDFDGDGRLDVMVTSSGPLDQMRLFHNNGDGSFSDVTAAAGLLGEVGGLNLVLTDYNNDGHPDVLVLRGAWWGKAGAYPMSLLRNNGDGTFDDVTEAAGLMSLHPTQAAAWADFDNDGLLDLFVGHESRKGDIHPSQLFHNNGDGTFTEMGAASGLADLGFVKGVAWGDFNRDGRPDLYVSVLGGHNYLFRNDGPLRPGQAAKEGWRFKNVTDEAGVATQRNSFATWFFDYDNDGWPDIFVAGYATDSDQDLGRFEMGLTHKAETPRLYRNNHDGTFSDVSQSVHLDRAILVMGANFGDLDNDGYLDVYLGTGDSTYQGLLPNRMFRNNGGKTFDDVTTAGGFGHLQKGHGVAFGDLEGTGNEDVLEEMGGALPGDTYQSAVYHNPGSGNHSLTVMLEGVETNRAAFGARICVTVRTKTGVRQIYRTVGYGSSFGGNPLRQHIGLADATQAESIVVEWPTSKKSQTFLNVAAETVLRVREGEPLSDTLRAQ